MFSNVKIETDRLLIRPYQDEDAQAIFEMVTEDNHFQYMPEGPINSIEEIESLIRWSKGCNAKNTKEKIYKFNLSVFLKETGEFIGICGLGPHDVYPEEVEVYYSLKKKFQGKGYAREAAQAVVVYGLNTIGLPKIVATVHPENGPSVKIIEGLGMEYQYILSGFEGDLVEHNGYAYYELELRK
jgi:[ribosomal protein S5]-alanine N-acetyltransferase